MIDKIIEETKNKLAEVIRLEEQKYREIEASLKAQKEIESNLRAEVIETNNKRKMMEEDYNKKTAEVVKLREELQNELAERVKIMDEVKNNEKLIKNSLDNAKYFSELKHDELEKQRRITEQHTLDCDKLEKLIYETKEKSKQFDLKIKDAMALASENQAKSEKLSRLEKVLNDREIELDNRAAELKRIERTLNGR